MASGALPPGRPRARDVRAKGVAAHTPKLQTEPTYVHYSGPCVRARETYNTVRANACLPLHMLNIGGAGAVNQMRPCLPPLFSRERRALIRFLSLYFASLCAGARGLARSPLFRALFCASPPALSHFLFTRLSPALLACSVWTSRPIADPTPAWCRRLPPAAFHSLTYTSLSIEIARALIRALNFTHARVISSRRFRPSIPNGPAATRIFPLPLLARSLFPGPSGARRLPRRGRPAEKRKISDAVQNVTL